MVTTPQSLTGNGLAVSRRTISLLLLIAPFVFGCELGPPPDHARVQVLTGSPYERGFQHGEAMADRIRSLQTTLLTSSLLPYLNRERAAVASVMLAYRDKDDDEFESYYQRYRRECLQEFPDDCRIKCGFAYLVMRDSARSLTPYLPQRYLDEMQGIADGAGLPFEQILVLNTFFDTLLSFRAITAFIRGVQAPRVERVRFLDLEERGDYDGADLPDEDWDKISGPHEPSPHAVAVEVSPRSAVEFLIHDTKLEVGTDLGEPPGVDPSTVRVRVDDVQYTYPEDDGILQVFEVPDDEERVRVVLIPPGGFAEAAQVSLVVQAGDFNAIIDPPPERARFMRDERITFTTAGFGREKHEVANRDPTPDGSIPPSISFAARGTATADGAPLLAHHYALLDANTVHKHAVLSVHHPDEGAAHAVLGYAGFIWGFSGMNEHGLTFAFNNSDTLNNPMTGAFLEELFQAEFSLRGVPIGIVGRELLASEETVGGAVDLLAAVSHTGGWNVLLADAEGDLAAVELDSNIDFEGAPADRTGAHVIRPDDRDEHGEPLAGISGDELYLGSHYRKNLEDIRTTALVFDVQPQRYWTTFYYRSVQATAVLRERLRQALGALDPERAKAILRFPELVDQRDSMNAAIYQPRSGTFLWAAGEIPATDGVFREFAFEPAGGDVK